MSMEIEGLDELIDSLDKAAEIPDRNLEKMLRAGAEVVTEAHVEGFNAINKKHPTGYTAEGVKSVQNKQLKGREIEIFPRGYRADDGQRNAKIGALWEYGVPSKGIPATHWMSRANESCADETTEAIKKEYDSFLSSLGL